MKQNIKNKLIAIFLAVLFVFSNMPTVYAEENQILLPSTTESTEEPPIFDFILPPVDLEDTGDKPENSKPPDDLKPPNNSSPSSNGEYDILLPKPDEKINDELILLPEQSNQGNFNIDDYYQDIYGIPLPANSPMLFSASGSDPYAYVTGNGGNLTIAADRALNNILHYDGKIVDNIHIAKWIQGDPAALEYPAYCKNPGWKGVAQNSAKQYQIKPKSSIGDAEKKILGVVRAGYPYQSPAELGLQDVDEAYYATNGAIHTAIVNGSLDNWSIKSGDEARNTRILNALKTIYSNGIANPYSPPPITVQLMPTSGNEQGTEDGDWITNTYEFKTDYPINAWKLNFPPAANYNAMVQSGQIEVYVGGTKASLQSNINGVWDDIDGFSISKGQSIEIKVKKSLASSTGLTIPMYGTISDVDFENCFTYLGDAELSGSWQGYCYNTVPYATDTSNFTSKKGDVVPIPPDITADPGSLVVQKLDAQTKQNVENAVFHIEGKSESCKSINITVKASKGAILPEFGGGASLSAADGVITMKGIPSGIYEITEISPPQNYNITADQNSQTVEVKKSDDEPAGVQVAFENEPFGSLIIKKVDADTGESLQGVFFKVENHTEGIEKTVETGGGGTVEISNLPQGNYEVTEIATRDDYILNEIPQTVAVTWGEETSVTFKNKSKPSIEILKIDSETGDAISGVVFQITNKDTKQSYNGITDGAGTVTLTGVDEGWFDIVEITPAPGYIAGDKTYEVYAESGKPGEITIKNTKRSGIVIEKTDSKGNPLEGVSFNIYNFGGVTPIPNSPVTTDKNGLAKLENLNPGHYQVQEVAPPYGFAIDNTKYDLIVEEGKEQTTRLKIVNKKLPDLTVKKVDTAENNKGLAGAVFEVKETDGQALPGSPYTTGPDGTFTIEKIDLGIKKSLKLTITEIQPPPGYHLSNPTVQYATMESDKDITLTFSNSKLPVLTIKKVDAKTKESLAKAIFSIEKLEEPGKGMVTGSPFTTDEKGEIKLVNQKPGSYKIVEITAPPNYMIDTAERIITLKEGEDFTATFQNTKKPTLIVHKVDSITKDPLAGAEFLVSKAQNNSFNGGVVEVGKYYSDADGRFTLPFVEPGWYRILETHPASGYREETNYYQDVFLQAGEDKEITFENTPKNAIIIRKVDSKTGEALANIRFQVRYLSGATGTEGTVIGIYRTSKNGTATVAGLKPGVYSIAEMESDSDHILDDTIQTVTLASDNAVVTVEFGNAPKGGLLIKKLDAVTKLPLSGIVFKVTDLKGTFVGEHNGEFITDETGTIYIPQLVGGYVVQEVRTKEGYILDGTPKTIDVGTGKVFSLEFFNQPLNSFSIQKLDGATKKPLAGARIKVMEADGTLIKEAVTDESGFIQLTGLKPGTYQVQEIEAPPGFNLDNTVKTIVLEQNKPQKIELYNYSKSAIQILKRDSVTKEPLENARFRITKLDGKIIGEFTSDAAGTAIVPNLETGSYTVQEVKAPDSYLLNDKPQTIEVKENKLYTLTFDNQPLNKFTIQKLDGATKKPLAGAKIKVSTASGDLVGEYVTDESGFIQLSGLQPGIYHVQEIAAPEGYNLNDTIKTVILKQNESPKIELYNYSKSAIQILKRDSVTKEPLENARFRITKLDGKIIGEFTSDAAGTAIVPNLEAGSYTVQEVKAPDNYLLNDKPQTIEVKENKLYTLTFDNQPLNKFTIQKLDGATKKPLAGAKIKVTTVSGDLVGEYVTDESGLIQLTGLKPGNYLVQEVSAPEGYNLNDTVKTVTLKQNESPKIELYNYKKSTILILKKDSVSKLPLANAVFKISMSDGKIIGEFKTDATGTATVPGLDAGSYVVQEVKSPDGYLLNSEAKNITVKENSIVNLEFYNSPMNSLIIVKMDGDTKEPLAGAKIKLTTADGTLIDEYRTNATGTITITGLLPGSYKVQEIQSPDSYLLDDTEQLVKLEQDKPKKIEIFNYKKPNLIIQKQDKNTHKLLEGAKFKVTKMNGEYVGEYTTSEDGKIVVPKLVPGWYTVSEIAAPKGYNLDDTTSRNIEVKSNVPAILTFQNNKIPTLKIQKKDKITGKTMAGVEFHITRSDGKDYGTFTTNKSGEILLENKLPAGNYTIEETKTINGYALDATPQKVSLSWGDEKTVQWYNYPYASMEIKKVDTSTKKGIPNVQFEVFDKNKKSIGSYKTDSKGYISIDKKFAEGTYYIQEKEPLEGYLSDDSMIAVQTKWGKTARIEVENKPIEGRLKIIKTSADNNAVTGILKDSPIENAEFTIYNEEGKEVETITTDKTGQALSSPIPYGKYTVKETKAAPYYVLDSTPIAFAIINEKETIEKKFTNKSAVLQVNVEKTGFKEVTAGEMVRYDFMNIQNRSAVGLSDFTLTEYLPADKIVPTRLFTGSYNQNLSYKILYKTNKNNQYKILKDNLFTDQVYEFDLKQGLQQGEAISEIRFEFGNVGVGFREVERPLLYCQTKIDLKNGSQFMNTVEVSGRYDMQVTKDSDTFITNVKAPEPERKGKLPRTGY